VSNFRTFPDFRRLPVIVVNRVAPFTCCICHQDQIGRPNQVVCGRRDCKRKHATDMVRKRRLKEQRRRVA